MRINYWETLIVPINKLIAQYHAQSNYPIAQGVILQRIDKLVEQAEPHYKDIRKSVSHLLFDF